MLTGDTVLGRGTTVVAHPDGRLDDYLESLDRLRHLAARGAVTTVLPGHGPSLGHAQQAVEHYHWVQPREMLDGLGMAETTPGPLIMVLQFVGFISYPLYLVHSALGVGLIALVASMLHLPGLVTALIVTAAMMLLAWGIAVWAEPAIAAVLRPAVKRLRHWLRVPSAAGMVEPLTPAAA